MLPAAATVIVPSKHHAFLQLQHPKVWPPFARLTGESYLTTRCLYDNILSTVICGPDHVLTCVPRPRERRPRTSTQRKTTSPFLPGHCDRGLLICLDERK